MIIMACVNLSLISRVVLFCMEANVESVALLTDNPATEGSEHIPQKFLHKRSSYCNQEEDEDRTDLRSEPGVS